MHGSQGQGKRPDINTETGCSRLVIYPKSIFAEVKVFLTDMDEVYLPDQRSWLDRKEDGIPGEKRVMIGKNEHLTMLY